MAFGLRQPDDVFEHLDERAVPAVSLVDGLGGAYERRGQLGRPSAAHQVIESGENDVEARVLHHPELRPFGRWLALEGNAELLGPANEAPPDGTRRLI